MKFFTLLMAFVASTAAFADVSTNANGQGHVQRYAAQIERESLEAAQLAKQLFQRGLYDRLTDEEVRAVAELSFVRDNAREFSAAVAAEAYQDTPVRSREAYHWLHRSFTVVERDAFITSQPELKYNNGPVARMERTVAHLRSFYQLAERVGWTLAEVVLISRELERHTANLYNLAARETDNRREAHILRILADLNQEAVQFQREASSVNTVGSARIVLADNFRRLQWRFNQLDRLIENPRWVRYSPAVKAAYEETRREYADLVNAFNGR
ncbi:MAG: hypothetical protein HY075_03180 [Deltaproteobacteria bacterium]|nr:hypothetical protein [Deltaproteobacteria bacterium]